jgi:hypothetical protein
LLTPFAILYLITGLYALLNDNLFQFINGARKVMLAPLLLLLGYNLKINKPDVLIESVLILVLGLQIPLSLITSYLYTGLFFEFPEPDYLTGTFGRGGSSSIAIFTAIMPAISIWLYNTKKINKNRLGLAIAFSLIIIAISDIKFTIIFLPLMLVFAALLPFQEQIDRKQRVLVLVTICITAALIITASAISLRSYSKLFRATNESELSLSLRMRTFLERYLRLENRGIFYSPSGKVVANRYGATLIALELASTDWQHALFGYGLDSTTRESLLGSSFIEKEVGLSGLESQVISRMLIETGWIGLLLFSSPLLAILFLTFRQLRDRRSSDHDIVISGIVFIYGLGMLISYPYGLYGLDLKTSGFFWLTTGIWLQSTVDSGK